MDEDQQGDMVEWKKVFEEDREFNQGGVGCGGGAGAGGRAAAGAHAASRLATLGRALCSWLAAPRLALCCKCAVGAQSGGVGQAAPA